MSKRLSYKHAIKRATKVLVDKDLSKKLVKQASETLSSKSKRSEKISAVKQIFSDYIRLFRSYINGSYRDVSWKSMLYITAVLLYFVTPTDLIPDFLPVTGLVDDATLAVWLYQHLTGEMTKFLEWEKQSHNIQDNNQYE